MKARANFEYKGKTTTILVSETVYYLQVLLEMSVYSNLKQELQKSEEREKAWSSAYDCLQWKYHKIFCDVFPDKEDEVFVNDFEIIGDEEIRVLVIDN